MRDERPRASRRRRIVLYGNVAGAPVQPGDLVSIEAAIDRDVHDVAEHVGAEGTVEYLDYGTGDGYPADPLIGVRFDGGAREAFWSEEIERHVECPGGMDLDTESATEAETLLRVAMPTPTLEVVRLGAARRAVGRARRAAAVRLAEDGLAPRVLPPDWPQSGEVRLRVSAVNATLTMLKKLRAPRLAIPPDRRPLDIDASVDPNGVLFFWGGWCSNWEPSFFEVDGITYNCVEQYMMAQKAVLFADAHALEKIMASPFPMAQKDFGRAVADYDDGTWVAQRYGIVLAGTLAKYRQDAELREMLLASAPAVIAEASPDDDVWGIGIAADDPRRHDTTLWGENLLGKALMEARDVLARQAEERHPDPLLLKRRVKNGPDEYDACAKKLVETRDYTPTGGHGIQVALGSLEGDWLDVDTTYQDATEAEAVAERIRVTLAGVLRVVAATKHAQGVADGLEQTMRCAACGKPASCFGTYEEGPSAFACDDCCDHGCEDGCCLPIQRINDPREEP